MGFSRDNGKENGSYYLVHRTRVAHVAKQADCLQAAVCSDHSSTTAAKEPCSSKLEQMHNDSQNISIFALPLLALLL